MPSPAMKADSCWSSRKTISLHCRRSNFWADTHNAVWNSRKKPRFPYLSVWYFPMLQLILRSHLSYRGHTDLLHSWKHNSWSSRFRWLLHHREYQYWIRHCSWQTHNFRFCLSWLIPTGLMTPCLRKYNRQKHGAR